LRVVDEQGRDVPRDGATLGEIVARGNVIMAGYYNDPEATATAMGGGWFHSGDAAVVHADGYVEIRDRFKDVIISGGENISSVEVEGVLLRHHRYWKWRWWACRTRNGGKRRTPSSCCVPASWPSKKKYTNFAAPTWPASRRPKGYSFVAELPKTATGKIQKYVLRGKQTAIARQ
jgi:fatty-acyl-CoA synthase